VNLLEKKILTEYLSLEHGVPPLCVRDARRPWQSTEAATIFGELGK